MPIEDLRSYIESRTEYLDEVQALLKESIPKDQAEIIKQHLLDILTHRPTLSTMLAKLEWFLDRALAEHLPIKDKGETDLDRKFKLDSQVSDYRYWRNLVDGLLETTDRQASAMQSLLSFEKKHLTQMGDVA